MQRIITHLFLLLIMTASLSAHAQDESILQKTSGSKVEIISITPVTNAPLKDGQRLTISAEVEYFLASPSGSLAVFVHNDDLDSLLIDDSTSVRITSGKGRITLSEEVLVKDAHSVHFVVAIYHKINQGTSVTAQRSYVVNKP